jgi:hypothetical protein
MPANPTHGTVAKQGVNMIVDYFMFLYLSCGCILEMLQATYTRVKRFMVHGSRLRRANLAAYKELRRIQRRWSLHPLSDCCSCPKADSNELWFNAFKTLNVERGTQNRSI